jgi:predicted transposase YdaD
MKESVTYQAIEAKGRQEGREEGRQEEGANLVLRLLNRRIGQVSSSFVSQIRVLSVEKLEDLGEALLDFQTEEDLQQWFSNL